LRFWDSTAILPLLVREPTTDKVEGLLHRDPDLVIWWGTPAECVSALARVRHEGGLSRSSLRRCLEILDHLRARALEVQPVEEVRARAERLLLVHPLRASSALQLAASLIWCRERPRGVKLVSFDALLRGAAVLEGFTVLPYPEEVHDADFPD
jgi:uncharacterized protein